MPQNNKQQHPDREGEMGAAGHEAESVTPSATGEAGLYASPIHKEGEEALKEGEKQSEKTSSR
ncbi:MAG: hypothetical protein AB7P40_11645 [Chloroflexota bacterium]